jgi:hypothetical protein
MKKAFEFSCPCTEEVKVFGLAINAYDYADMHEKTMRTQKCAVKITRIFIERKKSNA